MEYKIKLPIRYLVEFILRSGDIDNKFVPMDTMYMGALAHKRLQRSFGDNYSAEIPLSLTVSRGDTVIELEGRADGLIINDDGYTIDEIKTTMSPLSAINEEGEDVHWAQAECYAYIFALQNGIENIKVRLTYFQLETQETLFFYRDLNIKELESFVNSLINKYLFWAQLTSDWEEERNNSIKAADFPFKNYRKGQREMAVAVYKAIKNNKKLFADAPTGIGKTISAVFPAVKSMGEGLCSKIFYLTAKTITRRVAEEAFIKLQKRGLRFKTVTITAKDKICFCEKRVCNPEHCKYAKGHFDRINDTLADILTNETALNFNREIIENYAKKHAVCPYELSLDLSLWTDGVICDYNYVFDPTVYLRRFFSDEQNNYVLLIDEGHNLVDRSREMFSASLKKSDFLNMKKLLKASSPKLSKAFGDINKFLLEIGKECGDKNFYATDKRYTDIDFKLQNLIEKCDIYFKETADSDETKDAVLEVYFNILNFLKITEFFDERYISLTENYGSEIVLNLFCLDPSHLLNEVYKKCRAAVIFSATLTPLYYFKEVLGGDEGDYTLRLRSPFNQNNLSLLVADTISTRYKHREESYEPLADLIGKFTSAKKGNYIVFFPSYKYMNEVIGFFEWDYPDVKIIMQKNSMDETEREDFLNLFSEKAEETTVGFAVMGGVFSEGIDLKGDRLIGAMIIGVGLPQINVRSDIIRNYYNEKNNMGYEFAYMYPGMNKVLQAAGRVIRSEKDRGAVLLADDRFTENKYLNLFPAHWSHYKKIKSGNDLKTELDRFWNDNL